MKGSGWGRNRWLFLLLAGMGVLLFLLGGLLGNRDGGEDGSRAFEEKAKALCLSVKGVEHAEVFLTLNDGGIREESVFGKKAASGGAVTVRGIAVVCTGGESAEIRETVTELLAAAFGVPSNRIRVAGGE